MINWTEAPWKCPSCESEDQMVRNVQVPGGPPGSVRREATVVYEVRCGSCHIQYDATFTAASYKITTHHA